MIRRFRDFVIRLFVRLKPKSAEAKMEYDQWVEAGRPMRDPDWRRQIFNDHCGKCEYYDPEGLTILGDKGKCLDCGCHVDPDNDADSNKLNWLLYGCSLDPPKFEATVEGRRTTTFMVNPKPIRVRIGTINGQDPRNFKKKPKDQ